MAGRTVDTGVSGKRTSRRRFFQMLAGSPLLGLAYPALSPNWQRAVDRELQRDWAAGLRPAVGHCSDCGRPMAFGAQASGAPTHGAAALDEHLTGQLIETADEAINVWDFERVAHANSLPEEPLAKLLAC